MEKSNEAIVKALLPLPETPPRRGSSLGGRLLRSDMLWLPFIVER